MMNRAGKNYLKIGAVILAVLLAGAATWHWGWPTYQRAKQHRHLAEAQTYFDNGDYRNALMSARLVLMLDSNNVPACRIMAGLAETSRSPATLDWRQRIVELDPSVENKLALAAAGLQFQNPPFPITTQLLDDLTPAATNRAAYHAVATMLALRLNHPAEAERHMADAAQLEPTNQSFQLNLAVLRLNSANPAVVTAARGVLEQFCADTNFGPAALRSLVAERLLHQDLPAALGYSRQLLASPQAGLGDRLQHLSLLKDLASPDLAAQLKRVQADVATNALLAAQTAAWMQANGFRDDAGAWLTALPTGIQSQPAVQLALVDYYTGTTNWRGLCQLTAKGDWGEMNFLRLAFLSHAWDELGESLVAESQWKSAVNEAGDRLGALNALLELAGRWGKSAAQEQLLLRITQRYPEAAWAQQGLERLYLAAGKTAKLYELYAAQFARLPQNLALKNNLAATALLLHTNLMQACQWAAEIYGQRPAEPVIVSTYAFALHEQSRDAEGLAALQKLSPAQLEQPSVALYYGVLLAATDDKAKARPFLALAEKGGQLLPEEKRLLTEAGK